MADMEILPWQFADRLKLTMPVLPVMNSLTTIALAAVVGIVSYRRSTKARKERS